MQRRNDIIVDNISFLCMGQVEKEISAMDSVLMFKKKKKNNVE